MTEDSRTICIQVLKHRALLLAVIVAMVRDFDVAEDLLQETAMAIMHDKDRFDENRDFLAWAKGVARNTALRYLHSAKRREISVDPSSLMVLADAMMDAGEPETWEKERSGLRRCLEKLPKRSRELFELRYEKNLKGQGLASASGVGVGSLRTTLARVRTLLRNCVEGHLRQETPCQEGLA